MYEIHMFELRNEEINVKKILAAINATYAVAKRKPEKNQACRDPDLFTSLVIILFRDLSKSSTYLSVLSLYVR